MQASHAGLPAVGCSIVHGAQGRDLWHAVRRRALGEIDVSEKDEAQDEPRGELTVRTIAMPADTNANGDIFGGWVMSRMDQAGGIAGVDRTRGRVVTVAVEAMSFIRPVKVGDVLCVYTEVESVGRTSMRIHIEAWARRFQMNVREKVTDATFTFVAIDDLGKPRAIPRD
jgi:acyl-CoA thioesterase YciA